MDVINGTDVIKSFIACVKEYHKQRTETVSQKLQRNLQILCTISDRHIFDPNNTYGAEFYVSLYDLMSTLDSRTGLMWCAVSVLEEASKNPSAQHALVHKYKFTPILTQLLSGHLILDKQIKVLRLLQEFTYGVQILWQDAYLPLLITTLIKWIKNSDKSSELVPLSLGILVNLCYKNLPAVYVLRRVVDIKEFIRSLVCQDKDNLDIRVQAYKMLIILEEVSGEISDNAIMSCVHWSFKRIYEALEAGNVNAMRHLVGFFKDLKANNNFGSALLKYPSYSADTEKLLQLLESILETVKETECVNLLLEFLQSVILLEINDMTRLYKPIVKLTLNLSNTYPQINQMALHVICSVISESRKNGQSTHTAIMNEIDSALPVLLSFLRVEDSLGSSDKNSICSILGLLLELRQEPEICRKILSSLEPTVMRSILSPDAMKDESILDESTTSFYLQGLSLVSSFSSMEDRWNSLFSELMEHKKIKMKLAASLYTGSPNVKCQALRLIAHLGTDNRLLPELSYCMSELDKIVAPVINTSNINGYNMQQNFSVASSNQHCVTPLLSLAQQSRLDHCIATVEKAISENQLGSVGTAAVLELYEYRVAAMSHTESVLQGNLEAVDKYCTQLRHRLSIMTSEMNKLLSLLHSKEEIIETSQSAINSLQRDVLATESSLQISQKKFTEVVEELKAKNAVCEELCNELNNAKTALNEKQQENETLINRIQVLSDEIQTLKAKCKDFDELVLKLEGKEETIKQKLEQLKEMTIILQNREKKIEQQDAFIKSLEKSICDKDNEIAQYQADIAELEAMRDVIMKVTMDKDRKHPKKK